MYCRILQSSYLKKIEGQEKGKCRQVWMGDKESRGPSSGGAYGKKGLSLRGLIFPETERAIKIMANRSGHYKTELDLVLIRKQQL